MQYGKPLQSLICMMNKKLMNLL